MKKKRSHLYLIFSVVLGLAGLFYAHDLPQNNRETIFLTQQGIHNYNKFKADFHEKAFIILKKEFPEQIDLLSTQLFEEKAKTLKLFCQDQCEIITATTIPPSFDQLLKLKGDRFLALLIISEHDFIKKVLDQIEASPYWGTLSQDLHMVGVPFTNKQLNHYSKSVKETLFPMLFTSVLIILILVFRSLKLGLILFYPCLLSSSLSLAVTKYFFQESNLITSIVPLLMFVINLSLVLHILYTSMELKSVAQSLKDKSRPILLMMSTTTIGFLSLCLSDLQAISFFGLLAAPLIVLTSLTTLSWLLAADDMFYFSMRTQPTKNQSTHLLKSFFDRFYSKKTIAGLALFAMLCGGYFFTKIRVLTDATEYFPEESGLKKSMHNVSRTVLGPPVMDIILRSPQKINIETLKQISLLEKQLIQRLKTFDSQVKIISSNSLTQRANYSYTKEDKIPDYMIAYTSVRSQIPSELKAGFPIKSAYRLNIFASPMNVSQYEKWLQSASEIFGQSPFSIEFNGLYYHLMTAQKEMIHTLFKSFLASLFIISLMAYLSFKKLKVFFIFLFVNIVPVLLSFIVLKLFNLSFNIATVMTYSISLGLIVDSSFHIIHALDKKRLTSTYFYNTVTRPVLLASSILFLCFLIFAFNDFLPIKEFGLCLAIIIFVGMIFDLKVLPALYTNKQKI